MPDSSNSAINLDKLAAHSAQAIIRRTQGPIAGDPLACQAAASEVDNTVTKALGVLQENGFYAFTLFLASRKDKERDRARVVLDESLNLLAGLGFGWHKPEVVDDAATLDTATILGHITDSVLDDALERLLLAKETCEQMLVYARYGAKALDAATPPVAAGEED